MARCREFRECLKLIPWQAEEEKLIVHITSLERLAFLIQSDKEIIPFHVGN